MIRNANKEELKLEPDTLGESRRYGAWRPRKLDFRHVVLLGYFYCFYNFV